MIYLSNRMETLVVRMKRVKRLILLHKPLNLVNHVLSALTVHVLFVVVLQYALDSLLLFLVLLNYHFILRVELLG